MFNTLKIGQLVEVTYVSEKADAAQQTGKQEKPSQGQTSAQGQKPGEEQVTQASGTKAGQTTQATGDQSAQAVVGKLGKGAGGDPANLRAIRIQLLNTIGQPVPGGEPLPPAYATPPAPPAPTTSR